MRWILILMGLVFLSVGDTLSLGVKDYHRKALEHYGAGEYGLALESYRKALGLNKYDREAKFGMGKVFYEMGNYDESLRYLKEVEGLFREDKEIKKWLAKVQMRRGKLDGAESYLRMGLELSPRDYEIYILYGDLYMERRKYDRGLLAYREAIGIDDGEGLGYLKLGVSYMGMGDMSKAYEYLEGALSRLPRDSGVNYYFGEYYYHQKEYEESEEYLRKSISLGGEGRKAGFDLLYRVLYERKKWKEARDILEGLVEEYGDGKYYFHLGVILEKLGESLFGFRSIEGRDGSWDGG